MDAPTPELQALAALVAANSAPSREATTILAVDLAGPFASTRTRTIAGGDPAPGDAATLLTFLDDVKERTLPGDPAHGLVPFLAYYRLARPLASLWPTDPPLWTTDPALTGAWVATPPRGWELPETGNCVTLDGRLAALSHLATGATTDVRQHVVTLATWLVGRHRAIPTGASGTITHDPALRLDWRHAGPHDWWARSTESDPRSVADFLISADFLDSYEAPPPTPEEVAQEQVRQAIIEQGLIEDRKWRMRA